MIPTPIASIAQESGQTTQIARALKGRFKSVALQSRVATDTSIEAFTKAGLTVLEWDRVDANTRKHAGTVQFNFQVEGAGELDNVIAFLPKVAGQAFSIGTTFGGLDERDANGVPTRRPWRRLVGAAKANGCVIERVWVECYRADDVVHADLPRMLWQGTEYGIPAGLMMPLVGTYRDEMPSDYIGLKERAGDFGIYILEQTSDVAVDAFAAIVAPPAPPTPSRPPAELNAAIAALCDEWLTQQVGPQTRSRLRNIRRVAATSGNDAVWLAAQPGVTAALTDAGA